MGDVLRQLRTQGRARNRAWHGDQPDVGALYQATELGGEVGEALNVVKKLERERRGMVGSRATVVQLADELADVVICTDNLAARFGIDLGAAVVNKFNASSEKNGFPHRMVDPARVEPPPASADGQAMADLKFMRAWADSVILERAPDFVIGDDYLRRWWVIPRNPFANIYLHWINRSDDDRALHDHSWDNVSVLLSGGYREHTPDGTFDRSAGDVVQRKATDLHRLELVDGQPALSLFITGPKVREWGFDCPNGWVPWQQFTGFAETGDSAAVGRGCGE